MNDDDMYHYADYFTICSDTTTFCGLSILKVSNWVRILGYTEERLAWHDAHVSTCPKCVQLRPFKLLGEVIL
jgi:hypothetical protein